MRAYLTLLLIFTVINIIVTANPEDDRQPIKCRSHPPYSKLNRTEGFLEITRNENNCEYETADTMQLLILRTDNLKLRAGDDMQVIDDTINSVPTVFKPPFRAGYLITKAVQPKIIFNFNHTDNDSLMMVEYFLNVSSLTINGDIDSQFHISPINLPSFDLNLTKTITDWVHVEIDGARIEGTSLKHLLLEDSSKVVRIFFNGNQTVSVKTTRALTNCSGIFEDKVDEKDKTTPHEITGPEMSQLNGYRCVNLFKMANFGNSFHYEANFRDFLGLKDFDDELLLDDGSSSNRIRITKSDASDFSDQVRSFSGPELAVVYDSPRNNSPSNIQFHLTIQARAYGGIVDKQGPLTFPKQAGQVRYLLVPESQQYAAIVFPDDLITQDVNISISSNSKVLANFTGNFRIPPIITTDELDSKMIVDIAAKSFGQLSKVSFKSVSSTCHRVASGISGGFSVEGAQGPCYWTLASSGLNNLNRVSFNYDYPNGCLTIQPLTHDKPIYNKCNLTKSDILPNFILKQAYVKVDLPLNKTHLEASLLASPNLVTNNIVEAKTLHEIKSEGYPISYAWMSDSQFYILKGTGKEDYLLTFLDIDIRTGEKLLVNNMTIDTKRKMIDDMVLFNVTSANVTIARSTATADFGLRRGFKMVARRYDQIIFADLAKSNLTTPKNLTSLLVKISQPGKSFGKRIHFSVATAGDQTYDLNVYDGRSVQARLVNSTSSTPSIFSASSTSDTILLSLNVRKQNATLPELVLEYGTVSCNQTTDHVCDSFTRCVPIDKLCKGVAYCDDGSDLKLACSSGPVPPPQVIETGVAGVTVFVLCVLMLILGVVSSMYGPDLYKKLESQFRSGQYTTFTSTD